MSPRNAAQRHSEPTPHRLRRQVSMMQRNAALEDPQSTHGRPTATWKIENAWVGSWCGYGLRVETTGVVALKETLASLAALDPETLDDAAVRDSLLALLQCQHRLDAVIGRFVGAFDDRRLSHRDGFGTTKQWLVGFGRLSGPA